MWTPSRADLLVELCGSIEDDDVSLVEPSGGSGRAFEAYGANPGEDSDAADRAARAIADYIPMGQPILIGHHSERSARRDRGRIETNTRRAVQMRKTAAYWGTPRRRRPGDTRSTKSARTVAIENVR